jgi:hypothetical protein
MRKGHGLIPVRAGLFPLFFSLALLGGLVPSAFGSPYVREDGTKITLGNAYLEIVFEKATQGGIYAFRHKQAGLDYRTNRALPASLFRIRATKQVKIDNRSTNKFSHTRKKLPDGSIRVELTSEHAEHALRFIASVTVHPEDPMADFGIQIENQGPLSLVEVEFPVLNGNQRLGASAEDDVLVYPGWGTSRLIRDPVHTWDASCEFTAKDCHGGVGNRQIYPGWASTQMMAFYDPQGGFYLATYDDQMHTKAFTGGIWKTGNLRLSVRHLLEIRSGEGWSCPYNIRVGTFQGDWYDAADIYKSWARKQWWAKKTVRQKDTPPWFLEGLTFLHFYNYDEWAKAKQIDDIVYKLKDIAARTNRLAKQWKVPVVAMIHGWEDHGRSLPNPAKHNLVPPYVPPWEGEDRFRQATRRLREEGNYSMVYLGASLYGGLKKKWGEPVLDFALKNPKGRPYWSWGVKTPCMDPTTDFWKKELKTTTLKVLDLGLDVVQMDTWPCAYPQYRPQPGHPMGFGKWIGEAWSELIGEVRAQAREKNPRVAITSEEICEVYIPILDGYVSRDNAPDFNYQTGIPKDKVGKWSTIPLFTYVYHPYITTFGQIVVSRYGIARGFVRGKMPHLAGNTKDQKVLELFGKVARASHSYARDYILYGEMLRPQPAESPVITTRVSFFANLDVKPELPLNSRALFHSVWSHQGSVAYFYVNISDAPLSFSTKLEPYDLPYTDYRIIETRDGASSVLYPTTPLPRQTTIRIEPNQLIVLKIQRAE